MDRSRGRTLDRDSTARNYVLRIIPTGDELSFETWVGAELFILRTFGWYVESQDDPEGVVYFSQGRPMARLIAATDRTK